MSNQNEISRRDEMESVQTEFLLALEESRASGQAPALAQYVQRYPRVADEFVEWALNLVARREALEAQTSEAEDATVSPETQRVMNGVKAALRARPQTLNEAREAFGWSQFKLAEQLKLAPSITSELCSGTLSGCPSRLGAMVSESMLVPMSQARALLSNSRPASAHFKAEGDPTKQTFLTITFREALEDAAEQGELDQDKMQFWLRELDSESR